MRDTKHKKIIQQFCEYAIEQVLNGSIYLRGGQGERGYNLTDDYIAKREHNDASNIKRVKKTLERKRKSYRNEYICGYDCSGLVMYFMLSNGILTSDLTANGIKGKSKQIKREEVGEGDFCCHIDSSGRCTHIAIAIDNLNCVEARGRDYGVVMSEINDRGFDYYCRLSTWCD